jgi:flagellar basal body-associated protein FliL
MQKKSNRSNAVKIAVVGASLAGLAATAYFFFGPKGKKHRQHAKAWAIKMKGDVVEKLEAAREITQPIYQEIIDRVAIEYKKGKKASQPEIDALAKDLKKHWKSISKLAIAAKQEIVKDASEAAREAKK